MRPLLIFAGLVVFGLFLGQLITSAPGQVPLILAAATAMFFLTVLRPGVALVILIFAMLLSPEVIIGSIPKRNIVIRIEDVLIVVMGLAWIARSAIRKGADLIPQTPLNGWIGFYCVCFMIATGQGIIGGGVNPVKALFYVLKYLEYYIILFVVVGLAYTKEQYRRYLIAFFVTFMLVNLYAISQIGHVERVSAPFEGDQGEPNTLGGYQVLMMCLALGLYCHLKSRIGRWVMAGIAVITVLPFLHTLSRASYMAFIPAYLALIFYNRSSRRNILILVMVAAVVLGAWLLPETVKERFLYTFNARAQEGIDPVVLFGMTLDPSSSARWWDWAKAFEYWLRQPFFGYGIAGRSFLDSQYVNNLVETGALGFIAFAGLIGTLHYQVGRIYRRTTDDLVRGLALGFLAGNVGMLVHALTANTFILIRVMEPYWFLAGMILASGRLAPAAPASVPADIEKNPVPRQEGTGPKPSAFGLRNVGLLLRRDQGRSSRGDIDAT